MDLTILIAVVVGLIFPIYIFSTYQKVNKNILKEEKYRLIDYKQTIFQFWIMTLLIVLNFLVFNGPKLDFFPKMSVLNIGIAIAVIVFAFFQYKTTNIKDDMAENIKYKLKDVYHYLPKSKIELNWFTVLSFSAGICEEIIFRLFLFKFLIDYANIFVAGIITNIIFAVTHIGSGKQNLFNSFVLGILFTLIFFYTQNIWIAIILHIAIDFNAGILGYRINKLQFKNQ